MLPPWLRPAPDGSLLDVLVQPRASRTRVVGEHGDRLKLQLAAPPVDGEANAELCVFLSRQLEIPKRAVEVRSGATGRRKTVHLAGVAPEVALRLLLGS